MSQLGRKQALSDPAVWERAADTAAAAISEPQVDELVAAAAERVMVEAGTRRLAYGWSGGKDSQALRYVMEAAGVQDCVLAMTCGLEWPAMLAWLTDQMPPGCEVVAVPIDLAWLAQRPHMLFPQGRHGSAWFRYVQHTGQRQYVIDRQVQTLALGRRRRDGNYVGPAGSDRYTDRHGVCRWSPIADWTHEQVLALIRHKQLPLPPCYSWPRGWQVGTGPWPARQWTDSHDHGWSECWQIDPDVVRQAAAVLPTAADWMRRTGRT